MTEPSTESSSETPTTQNSHSESSSESSSVASTSSSTSSSSDSSSTSSSSSSTSDSSSTSSSSSSSSTSDSSAQSNSTPQFATVEDWIASLGLTKEQCEEYSKKFNDQEVRMSQLQTFGESDLADIGVTDPEVKEKMVKGLDVLKGPKKEKRKREEDENKPNRTIFVGGLSYDALEEDVEEFFQSCGEVIRVKIPHYTGSGRSRGMAFVEFKSDEGLKKALEKDGTTHMDRYLQIKLSTSGEKKQRGPRKEFPPPTPGKREGTKTIFIGNLSWEADEDALKDVFKDCGEITSVRIARYKESGRSRGFGHVEFKETESVDKAIAKSGMTISGREIRVDYSEPKHDGEGSNEPPPRRGGRGGRGRGRGRGGRGRGRGGGGGYGGGGRRSGGGYGDYDRDYDRGYGGGGYRRDRYRGY